MRAVGNTIIKPEIKSEQGWTGKVIKHQTGQGPLYIRATEDLDVLVRIKNPADFSREKNILFLQYFIPSYKSKTKTKPFQFGTIIYEELFFI